MCKESRRVQLLILSVIFFRFSSLKPCQRWQKMRHLLRSNIGEFLWKNEFCSSVVCGRTVMTKFLVINLLMRLLRSSEGWRGFMQKFVNYGCKTPLLSSSIHAKLFVKDIATSTTKAKEILITRTTQMHVTAPLLRLECRLYLLQQLLAKLHSFWWSGLSPVTVKSRSSQISAEIQNTTRGWIAML